MKYSCLVGSKLLDLNNPSDTDILVIADRGLNSTFRTYNGRLLNFAHHPRYSQDLFVGQYIYQYSQGFHPDEEYPFKWFNIFDHKERWLASLKNSLDKQMLSLNLDEALPKHFYHYLYQYYMIVENTHRISAEALAEVQKIHDLQVKGDYVYHLKELIDSLSEN